jgi:hypothetical protein
VRREDCFPGNISLEDALAKFERNHAALLGCNFTSTDYAVRQHFSPDVMTCNLLVYDCNQPEAALARWSNHATGKMNGILARRTTTIDSDGSRGPDHGKAWEQVLDMGAFATFLDVDIDLLTVEDVRAPIERAYALPLFDQRKNMAKSYPLTKSRP